MNTLSIYLLQLRHFLFCYLYGPRTVGFQPTQHKPVSGATMRDHLSHTSSIYSSAVNIANCRCPCAHSRVWREVLLCSFNLGTRW